MKNDLAHAAHSVGTRSGARKRPSSSLIPDRRATDRSNDSADPYHSVRKHRNALKRTRGMVLLTEGLTAPLTAKTAINLMRYRPQDVRAILDSTAAGQSASELLHLDDSIDVPIIGCLSNVQEADTLVIGTAIAQGDLPAEFSQPIEQALQMGWTVVSGLHHSLAMIPQFRNAMDRFGGRIIDIRDNDESTVSSGQALSLQTLRVLTVGHDCGCGKMVTALELDTALRRRGEDSRFVATGQTGIMVCGEGLPIDAVTGDFLSGAAEKLVLANRQHDIVVVEGQGSVAHPRFSGVSLGLLHGVSPQAAIFCFELGRPHVKGMPGVPLHPVPELIERHEQIAALVGPMKIVGVAAKTNQVTETEATQAMQALEARIGLPVVDVFRSGADRLADAILNYREVCESEEAS